MSQTQSQTAGADDTEILDNIEKFYRRYYEEEIAELAQKYPSDQSSLAVSWSDINKFSMAMGDDVREKPGQIRRYFEEALRNYDLPVDIDLKSATVRFTDLPSTAEYDVTDLRTDDRDTLVTVRGQVSKRTDVQPRIELAAYECQRCGTLTNIPQEGKQIQKPHECQGCERQGPFRINHRKSEFADVQTIRLQEPPEKTKGGNSSTLDIRVKGNDVVNTADGGDRVSISGVFKFESKNDDSRIQDTYLKGDDIMVEETDYEDIDVDEFEEEILELANSDRSLETLADSLAPSIHGLDEIKKAVTLQLFGGTSGDDSRGDFHILMIGDPGCGKSTILESAVEIAPRSTKASGKGASKSGLTAAAVRDDFGDSEWSLEAGAMVLADKGLCGIDEIDKTDEEATSALHDALESQEVPIHKAGINTELPTRTSLLAAGNPKFGRFDRFEPIGEQIDIAPALLSRFDLIFTLQDEPDLEKDENVARHNVRYGRADKRSKHHNQQPPENVEPDVSPELFRAYVAYAKQNYAPIITEEHEDRIVEWYLSFRELAANDSDAPIPITPRWIDAMQRLSEAAARARLSNTVEQQDIDTASELILRVFRDVGMDPESGEMDVDIVETGTSKSQRDRIKKILNLVEELEEEFNKGAPHDVLVTRAEELEISESKVEHEIDQLKQKGDIYEHKSGSYRTA